jgi:hypothetical protein
MVINVLLFYTVKGKIYNQNIFKGRTKISLKDDFYQVWERSAKL